MQIAHTISPDLLSRRALKVLVVGCGGTGSAIAMGLPYLDQAMRVWGHTHGLDVTMMDADVVSETNCIRQPFSASDIGLNKATVLINRLNLFWGAAWSAIPNHFHTRSLDGNFEQRPDLLIGCVSNRLEPAACRWVDQESFLSRASIAYVDTGLFASLISPSVEISVPNPRRLINRLHVQIFADSVSKRVEIQSVGEVVVITSLLIRHPFTCLRRASVLEPAVGIADDNAMNQFFDGTWNGGAQWHRISCRPGACTTRSICRARLRE
jgi:hypothetical protein